MERMTYVDPCPGMKGDDIVTENCDRCAGSGYIPEYGHVYGGECFQCNAGGLLYRKVKNVRAVEHRVVNDHNRAIDDEQRGAARIAALPTDDPALAAALDALGADDDFAESIIGQIRSGKNLSERQRSAVLASAQRTADRAAEDAAAADVPVGRVEVSGVVLTIKWVDGMYRDTQKMLVKADSGFKVWGTVPTSIMEADKGDRVTFTATVEPSKDDPKFGFYKRPAKAVIV